MAPLKKRKPPHPAASSTTTLGPAATGGRRGRAGAKDLEREGARNLAARQEFVEKMGLFFGDGGLPRMAGRIVGWLLICAPAHQSANEIGAMVGASKASVSSNVRLLLHHGLIERFCLPGERCDQYRIQPGSWKDHHRRHMANVTAMRRLAEEGLQLLVGEPAATRARLLELRELFGFFERELPGLMMHYERQQERHPGERAARAPRRR